MSQPVSVTTNCIMLFVVAAITAVSLLIPEAVAQDGSYLRVLPMCSIDLLFSGKGPEGPPPPGRFYVNSVPRVSTCDSLARFVVRNPDCKKVQCLRRARCVACRIDYPDWSIALVVPSAPWNKYWWVNEPGCTQWICALQGGYTPWGR
jgi:hypothetical protein